MAISPHKMRLLDVWLGKPLCALLTLTRAAGRLVGRRDKLDRPVGKILFIKLIEQGATILAADALKRAAEIVGRGNVYFLVFEENRAILDLLGLVDTDNVISIRTGSPFTLVRDSLAALRRIRRLKIDCAIDMEFFARGSAVITYLTRARVRVGHDRFTSEGPYRGNLMTHRVEYNPYLHTAAAYRALVEAISSDPADTPLLKQSMPATEPPPTFEPTKAEVEDVRKLLRNAAGREVRSPIVLLNPNASDIIPLRKWPTERFTELARRLLDEFDSLTVVITGAPAEKEAGEQMAWQIGSDRAISLAGKTSLRELLALYSISDALVTNDSGPGHFASITPIDSVVLFGPETPRLYGPIGERSHVIWAGLACSPCVNAFNHRLSPCKNSVCMQAITVDQVLESVREALGSRGADAG